MIEIVGWVAGGLFAVCGLPLVDELKQHLESLFQPGMTWDNYGNGGWEIDHKTPDSWFQYNSVNDQGFKDSWALANLQPMWATDNHRKGNTYEG